MRTRRSGLTAACTLALILAGAGLSAQALAAVFTVDTAADITDATPGDGFCDSGAGSCSLRAAIMEANALAGADEIQFDPALASTPIELTLSAASPDEGFDDSVTPPVPTATPDASVGDLDVTDTLTITGLDPDRVDDTLIRWAAAVEAPDRIFHVEAVSANISVVMSNLAIGNGAVDEIDIPDATTETNYVLVRRGGAITLGQGAAVVDRLAVSGPDDGGAPDGIGGGPPDDHDEEGFAIEAATLSRVLIFGSSASGDGGGLFNAAPLTLVDSVITGNISGANGGGLYNDAASTIRGSTIGAVAETADLPFVVDDSLLTTGNQGENGGGIFDTGFHTTRIEASAINRNNAIGGGGIAARSLIIVELVNSTVSGNLATDVGGGITTNGTVSLLNSTVADNTASTDAPGGGAGLNSFGSGTYFFTNSIIANNNKTGDETSTLSNCGCSGGAVTCPPLVMNSDGANIEDGESCALDEPDDLPLTDPLLLALTNMDPETLVAASTEYHPLQRSELGVSPAIDAGDDTVCPNNDQRGSIRPADGDLDTVAVCDIGAYELFVPVSDLAITNLQMPDRADTGEVFQIVATATNGSADTAATATSLTVTLPAGLSAGAASFAVDGGGPSDCTEAAGTVTCAVGTLAAGAVAEATVEATGDAQGSYEVTAEVNSEVADEVPANNQASASIFLVGSADLALTARANVGTVELGDRLTVIFTVTNAGPDDATGVRLAGNVPAQAAFVSASADNGGTCTEQDGTVVCELGSLPVASPTANVSVVLRAVSTGAVQAAATVEADQRDPVEANNTVATSFTFEEEDDDNNGLFGCTANPGGAIDPLLPALLAGGLGWIGLRRRLART